MGDAGQVRDAHLEKLGPQLGPLYHALWNECAWMHVRWQQFEELFATNEKRLEILNAAGGTFFCVVHDALWEGILIHLTALTDPPQSAGKDNLTLQAIPPLLPDQLHRPEIEDLVSKARTAAGFARDWRNRKIAHRDLSLVLSDGASRPLAAASLQDVRDGMESVGDVLRRVSLLYLDSDIAFRLVPPLGGAGDVLYYLRDGLKSEHRRRERLSGGQYLEDDWNQEPL